MTQYLCLSIRPPAQGHRDVMENTWYVPPTDMLLLWKHNFEEMLLISFSLSTYSLCDEEILLFTKRNLKQAGLWSDLIRLMSIFSRLLAEPNWYRELIDSSWCTVIRMCHPMRHYCFFVASETIGYLLLHKKGISWFENNWKIAMGGFLIQA